MAGSTPIAVKFVTKQNPRELRRFVHEIGILKSLRHTNIVQVRFQICCHLTSIEAKEGGGAKFSASYPRST